MGPKIFLALLVLAEEGDTAQQMGQEERRGVVAQRRYPTCER
jgi:hypothetical protein